MVRCWPILGLSLFLELIWIRLISIRGGQDIPGGPNLQNDFDQRGSHEASSRCQVRQAPAWIQSGQSVCATGKVPVTRPEDRPCYSAGWLRSTTSSAASQSSNSGWAREAGQAGVEGSPTIFATRQASRLASQSEGWSASSSPLLGWLASAASRPAIQASDPRRGRESGSACLGRSRRFPWGHSCDAQRAQSSRNVFGCAFAWILGADEFGGGQGGNRECQTGRGIGE